MRIDCMPLRPANLDPKLREGKVNLSWSQKLLILTADRCNQNFAGKLYVIIPPVNKRGIIVHFGAKIFSFSSIKIKRFGLTTTLNVDFTFRTLFLRPFFCAWTERENLMIFQQWNPQHVCVWDEPSMSAFVLKVELKHGWHGSSPCVEPFFVIPSDKAEKWFMLLSHHHKKTFRKSCETLHRSDDDNRKSWGLWTEFLRHVSHDVFLIMEVCESSHRHRRTWGETQLSSLTNTTASIRKNFFHSSFKRILLDR